MPSSKENLSRTRTQISHSNTIQSANHALVRWVAALKDRPERDKRRQFAIEGVRLINAALDHDALDTLLFAPLEPHSFGAHLLGRARRAGVRCVVVAPAILESLAFNQSQGLIGVANSPEIRLVPDYAAQPDENGRPLPFVALETIRKPGNIGSILRTATASGASGIVAVGDDVDFFASGAVRSSMGAVFSIPLLRAAWPVFLEWKRKQGHFWAGTSLVPGSQVFDGLDYPQSTVVWMGNEQKGLSKRTQQACDALVHIPMRPGVDSLNVAVATALMLYELRRQRDMVSSQS